MAMRSRLMTTCKGFPGAKPLRQELATVTSIQDVINVAGAGVPLGYSRPEAKPVTVA